LDLREVAGEWRRIHIEELCNFHTSPNVIGIIKSWRVRRAGHVAHTGGMINA
jgi:hypothetical protein